MSAQRKQPALDLLRLLAALMVLAVHTGQAAGLDAWTRTGAYGVELFFILKANAITLTELFARSRTDLALLTKSAYLRCRRRDLWRLRILLNIC